MAHDRLIKAEKPAECGDSESRPLQFLAYAMQGEKGDRQPFKCSGFELHDEPLLSSASFLDFDGVVMFAGAYEAVQNDGWHRSVSCVALADLDRREREFFTVIERGGVFVFLVPYVPKRIECELVDSRCDLFRRVARNWKMNWENTERPFPAVESLVPELNRYVATHGIGYLALCPDRNTQDSFTPLCKGSQNYYGGVLLRTIFFLPCPIPQNHEHSLQIATAAVEAVIAYRTRMSQEMPEWIADFSFSKESLLQSQTGDLRAQIAQLDTQIDSYISFKGSLCYQSDPLVEVVCRTLHHFFDLSLTIDDKCIEDAMIKDEHGTVQAVVEIKGVKNNFSRANVNQVDSHRERLNLPADVPGILIMNTLMGAASLQQKDQAPHPDIIQKATTERVLLIRTLDLLRYADGIEHGILTKESFRNTILTKSGWLKVTNNTAEVVSK